MSVVEFKAPRPLEQIQQDYQRTCTQVGNLQYQIWALDKDLQLLNEQLRDLSLEGAASNKAAQEAAKPINTDEAKDV